MSKAATQETTSAVVVSSLSADELNALLQQHGWAERPSGDKLPRMTLEGGMITTSDGDQFIYNPKTPTVPALTVRIVKSAEEYYGIWISENIARQFGRPELASTFSKQYMIPDANRRVWDSDLAFKDLKARTDILDDYGKPLKASWKADMLVQIVPPSGQLTGEETTYILSLAATSVAEYKGSYRDPEKGAVSEYNFIQKLSRFAMEQAIENGEAPAQAVLSALTSLTLGGVVAEVRIARMENKELGRSWSVLVFDPIHIEPVPQQNVLETGDDEDPGL